MKKTLLSIVAFTTLAFSQNITYKVDGKEYEGFYKSPSKDSPLVFLVHDWDGVNDYEKKRVEMLNDLGYAAFAVDLYGKGNRPTEFKDKKGKCLNCGKLTYFYDEGYFCTNKCR